MSVSVSITVNVSVSVTVSVSDNESITVNVSDNVSVSVIVTWVFSICGRPPCMRLWRAVQWGGAGRALTAGQASNCR